jgi:hypothetical protein
LTGALTVADRQRRARRVTLVASAFFFRSYPEDDMRSIKREEPAALPK